MNKEKSIEDAMQIFYMWLQDWEEHHTLSKNIAKSFRKEFQK